MGTQEDLYHYFMVLGVQLSPPSLQAELATLSVPDHARQVDQVVYHLVAMAEAPPPNAPHRAMFVISARDGLPHDQGLRYLHALECLLPISYFCAAKIQPQMTAFPISDCAYSSLPQPWSAEDMVEPCAEEIADRYAVPDEFLVACYTGIVESHRWAVGVAPLLRRYVADVAFQCGCSYLYLSMRELGYDVCDWATARYDQSFRRYVTVGRAESAFLNAFKCIESVVGEPSKNRTEAKLRERLISRGVDPDQPAGIGEPEALWQKIISYHRIRDSIAAHGLGRTKRDLLLSEIIDLQLVARQLLCGQVTVGPAA